MSGLRGVKQSGQAWNSPLKTAKKILDPDRDPDQWPSFKLIYVCGNCSIFIKISLKYMPKDRADNKWSWHQTGDKT